MTSQEFIQSGIIEQYVLGMANEEESLAVEHFAASDPAIKQEMDAISMYIENIAMENAVQPDPLIKPFLMAVIDYSERIKNGEPVVEPPVLNTKSSQEDYAAWLNRNDLMYAGTDDIFARIIGYTSEVTTAIVWIKHYAPQEVHHKEYERFLIIEGTCDFIVDNDTIHLAAGDFFEVPLHKNHMLKVTSALPCKVILQRVAA